MSDEEAFLPAIHALHLAEVAARFRVTQAELFADTGLSEAQLSDPRERISVAMVERLVSRARALTGEPALGFLLGLQMRISAHGYLGFAAMAASTVGEALDIAARFAPTRTNALALRLNVEGRTAALVIEPRASFGSAEDVVIVALAYGIGQIGRALTGRELHGGADFTFPEPPYFARFRKHISGPVRFDRPAHQLVFDSATLDYPLVMADPSAFRLATEQCDRELDALGTVAHLTSKVRSALRRRNHPARSLEETAEVLHVSTRTLKRKLASEGTAFSKLLEEARRERALLLLQSPTLSIEHIAERVGYSDVANFTRAFRRWTGQTPGQMRRSGRG